MATALVLRDSFPNIQPEIRLHHPAVPQSAEKLLPYVHKAKVTSTASATVLFPSPQWANDCSSEHKVCTIRKEPEDNFFLTHPS